MSLRNLKIAFHTLGCKVNIYETEVMQQLTEKAGAVTVPFQEKADVYVINTCSVTNMADRKSRQMLNRAKALNPEALVVACGCYVQLNPDDALQKTGADLLIGNGDKSHIAERIDAALNGTAGDGQDEGGSFDMSAFDPMSLRQLGAHTRADIKVQDGCNQFCAYCVIPYARGRVRSKKPEDVYFEISELVRNGVREFVLTGIHLSSYGLDLEEKTGLIELIEGVHRIPGVERIRFGSMEPRIVTEDFARRLAALPKICPHFHLSLQSGSESVLKRMNRHYTPEAYEAACRLLRAYFDDPALTTDVIVGFPQETEEEFRESLAFVRKIGFYELHVFMYSRRKGTKADRMDGQVPESVKKERSREMIEAGREMSLEYRRRSLGRQASVLTEEIEEIGGKRYMCGYTREYLRAALPEDTPSNEILEGKLAEMLTEDRVSFDISQKINESRLEEIPRIG